MFSTKTHFCFSLVFITVLSLWIRLSYFEEIVIDTPIRGDAAHYVQYANNLLEYKIFSKGRGNATPKPDAYWAPGYPVLIAISMVVGDKLNIDAYEFLMYLQIVLGVLTAVLTFLLGRLFLNRNWSIIPAILVSLSPHLISMGGYVLTETLFTFLILLAIYSFSIALINKSKLYFTISGLFFGFSYLVNPVMFFAPILLVIAVGVVSSSSENKEKTGIKHMLVFCLLSFFVVMGSWTVRNILNVPPSSSSSSERLLTNLVIGSHSNFYDVWRANPRDPNNPATKDEEALEGSYAAFASLLSERITHDPGHYAKWYLIDKPILLWNWNILIGQGDIYVYPVIVSLYQRSKLAIATYSIMKSLHYWLLGFAILGFFLLFKDAKSEVPMFLYITLVYISAVYVVTQSEARYSIPLRPEMYLCAVFFVSKVFDYLKSTEN